jgi:hypothetical protein
MYGLNIKPTMTNINLPILAVWYKIYIVQYWQNFNVGNTGQKQTLAYVVEHWPICPLHPILVLNRANNCPACQILPEDYLSNDSPMVSSAIDPFTNLCKLSHFSSSNHFRMAESLWAWLSSVTGSSTTSCLVRF